MAKSKAERGHLGAAHMTQASNIKEQRGSRLCFIATVWSGLDGTSDEAMIWLAFRCFQYNEAIAVVT